MAFILQRLSQTWEWDFKETYILLHFSDRRIVFQKHKTKQE